MLSPEQCAAVIAEHRGGLSRSTVTTEGLQSWVRTSSSCKIDALTGDVGDALATFVDTHLGRDASARLERWELLRYEFGQRYQRHVDYFGDNDKGERGERLASIIVYLNEGMKGGCTAFPFLRRLVMPEVGKAIYWRNIHEGKTLRASAHEARPVFGGEKWVLVSWLRER